MMSHLIWFMSYDTGQTSFKLKNTSLPSFKRACFATPAWWRRRPASPRSHRVPDCGTAENLICSLCCVANETTAVVMLQHAIMYNWHTKQDETFKFRVKSLQKQFQNYFAGKWHWHLARVSTYAGMTKQYRVSQNMHVCYLANKITTCTRHIQNRTAPPDSSRQPGAWPTTPAWRPLHRLSTGLCDWSYPCQRSRDNTANDDRPLLINPLRCTHRIHKYARAHLVTGKRTLLHGAQCYACRLRRAVRTVPIAGRYVITECGVSVDQICNYIRLLHSGFWLKNSFQMETGLCRIHRNNLKATPTR
jgi:hypothetical protein